MNEVLCAAGILIFVACVAAFLVVTGRAYASQFTFEHKKVRGMTVDDKKIPMAVIYECDGYADGCPVDDVAYCPICDYEFEEGREPWGRKYCPECGQRIKWEG